MIQHSTSRSFHADVLLVTVTEVETMAVLTVFPSTTKHFVGDKTYYDLGEVGGVRIFLVQSEMGAGGPSGAIRTVEKGIALFSPSAVVMVGIAFGANQEKQQIGSILVSERILDYELQKVSTGFNSELVIIPHGDKVSASSRLLNRFRDGAMEWKRAGETAKVEFGLILSGYKLVANQDFRKQLQGFGPEAVGGEMEGAGLYAAAQGNKVDWILVKAICDWADGSKDDTYQQLAAYNAARFTKYVIQQGGLRLKQSQVLPSFDNRYPENSKTRSSAIPNHLPKPATSPTVVIPFASSPNLLPANSSFSTLPARKQATNQWPVRILLVAVLVIVLLAGFLSFYFYRLAVQRTPSSTPTTVQASPSSTPTTAQASPSSTVSVLTPGTLTVGVTDNSFTYPPELYQDNNGQPAGFDIDLMKAIARAMKLNINIQQYPVDSLTPPQLFTILEAKQFDVMIDGQALTDQVNTNALSVAYLNVKDVLLVPNGNPGHLSANALTDFCGHTIGVQDNTVEMYRVQATHCPQGRVNTVVLPDSNSLVNALLQKQDNIEGIYQSTPTVSYYLYQFPGKFEAVGTPFQTQKEGIIIRQGNYNMYFAIQNALTSLEHDGTYSKLLKTSMGDLSGDSILG